MKRSRRATIPPFGGNQSAKHRQTARPEERRFSHWAESDPWRLIWGMFRGILRPEGYPLDMRWIIESGKALPGTKLSTEDELAKEYGVSRQVARNAFRDLCKMGLVEARQGQGHFVVDRSPRFGEKIPAGYELRIRMPWPEEVKQLGLLKDGEPVVEICLAGIVIEVTGTLGKTISLNPGED